MAALTEAVCAVWDDVRDTAYFRIVADLFTPGFTFGATVLLASYDDECEAQSSVMDVDREATDRTLAPHRLSTRIR